MAAAWTYSGTAAGAALLLVVSAHWLSLWLGLVVLIAVIVSLLPHRLEPTPTRLLIVGFLSGFMGTSSSIGGPPMALLLQHQAANHIRANMAAFFIVSGFMTLIALTMIGHMTLYHVGLALPLIPAAIIGYLIANKVIHRIDKQQMRWLSLVLCSLSAASAIGHFFYQQFWAS